MVVMQPSFGISAWFLVFVTVTIFQSTATAKGTESTTQLTSTTRATSSSGNNLTTSGTKSSTQLTSTTRATSSSFKNMTSSGTKSSTQLTSTTRATSSSFKNLTSSGTSTKTSIPAYTSSTVLNGTLSTSQVLSYDKQSDDQQFPKFLIIILIVIGTVLLLSAILIIVFILHRRRRLKKSPQEVSPKNQLPDALINHNDTSFGGLYQDYKAVKSSKYDTPNDENIVSYSTPVKKKGNGCTIAHHQKNAVGHCVTDEYDTLEFEKEYAVKMANYDSVSSSEVKALHDTYSHISSQSTPAFVVPVNVYSHCKLVRKESSSNVNTDKADDANELRTADQYSHVNFISETTKRISSNNIEEDSYNHIDLDKTTNPPRNGHAVNVRTIAKSEDESRVVTNLQALDVESEARPIFDRNSNVYSKDHPQQDTKAASLPNGYMEFKICETVDTPSCNYELCNLVLKEAKEQVFNENESFRQSATENNDGATENYTFRSDYELAKAI